MMKIKLLTTFVFATIFSLQLVAQDPQFSQFYASPMQLNPAMTGVFPGQWRAVANYRQQWNSILNTRPFRTISASFDAKVPVGRGDFFSFGMTTLRDEAGIADYNRTSVDLSLSFMKQLGGSRYRGADQFLVGGVQVGFGQHNISPEKLWFSNQFNTTTEEIDQSINSGENIESSSDLFLNVNAGLLWYAVFDDNQSLYVGGAIHHVNQPEVSFLANSSEGTLESKYTVHLGGEIPFNSRLSILPAVAVVSQGPSLISLYGANFRLTNRDWKEIAIRAGAWGHLVKDVEGSIASPAVTFTTILEIERWNIGLSYDLAANQLAPPTNGRGAFEVSLIYYQKSAGRKYRVECPKM
ncbi:MAG: PorP/SprF family type IX secretion system membrane protein [Bacteroidota bacterium]